LCAEFERLEDELAGTHADMTPGRFERTSWKRELGPNGEDRGGGTMSVMRGRVFEKVGVNVSAVFGEFSPEFRQPDSRRGRGSALLRHRGVLVAHMRSPKVPAVHMNTRFIATTRAWFGGGADLTPMSRMPPTRRTSTPPSDRPAMRTIRPYYPRFKEWCDEYFHLPHRGEARGVGGIFYDYLDSGDHARDFAFTRAVGENFLATLPHAGTTAHEQALDPGRARASTGQARPLRRVSTCSTIAAPNSA